MFLYTVVDEGYCVDVYRTQKAVAESLASEGLTLREDDEAAAPATENEIVAALRKDGVVRLYEIGQRDWKYRIEKQSRIY